MSIPSDNVNMLKIVGHPNGRIFMLGEDANVYELRYQRNVWMEGHPACLFSLVPFLPSRPLSSFSFLVSRVCREWSM